MLLAALTIKDVIAGEVVTLDDARVLLEAHASTGRTSPPRFPHRLLYNMTTFATYLVYWAPGGAGETLEVSLHLASAGTPAVRDGAAATTVKLHDAIRDETAKTSTARVSLSHRPLLLDFNFGAEEVYALRSEAAERATPTVDEIVFRHQQAETAQAALVRNYMANARINIHFQPTPLDSYDVIIENRFFSDTQTAEWEELSFSLNGTRWGRNRPPFPLLQPEKVLSLPLALRLNRDYVYHLVGLDRVDDRPCYVVGFDPVDQTKSLYRGKVWIDTERYVRLKVQAVQTGLAAPVVSNEEVQIYEAGAETRQSARLPVLQADEPADHADRRPQPARRETGRLLGLPRQRRGVLRPSGSRRAAATTSCTATPTRGCGTSSSAARNASSATR